jgi:hypothetical protein
VRKCAVYDNETRLSPRTATYTYDPNLDVDEGADFDADSPYPEVRSAVGTSQALDM